MPPKPAPMTPLSQRLRNAVQELRLSSDATKWVYVDALFDAADRLDALAALRPDVAWVRKFIEYARYELEPGESQPFDQFPRQAEADKAMAKLDAWLALLPEEGR